MLLCEYNFLKVIGILCATYGCFAQTHILPLTRYNETIINHYVGHLEADISPFPIKIKEGETITIHGTMQFLKEIPLNTIIGLNFTYTFEDTNYTLPIPCINLTKFTDLVSYIYKNYPT